QGPTGHAPPTQDPGEPGDDQLVHVFGHLFLHQVSVHPLAGLVLGEGGPVDEGHPAGRGIVRLCTAHANDRSTEVSEVVPSRRFRMRDIFERNLRDPTNGSQGPTYDTLPLTPVASSRSPLRLRKSGTTAASQVLPR